MLFYIIATVLVIGTITVKIRQVRDRRQEVAREAQKRISAKKWQQELDVSAQQVLHARTPKEAWRVFASLSNSVIEQLDHYWNHPQGTPLRHASNKYLYYVKARSRQGARQDHARRRHEIIEGLFEAESLKSRLEKLASLVYHERRKKQSHDDEQELQEAIEGYLNDTGLCNEMFAIAERDLEGYLEITDFMKEIRNRERLIHVSTLAELRDFIAYPINWYELVVRFRQDPDIGEFPHVGRLGMTSMQIAENAAIAVRDRDLVGAQIARAHAANTARHREMMGDVLLEQLHRLVAELHKEQGLFQDETESVKG